MKIRKFILGGALGSVALLTGNTAQALNYFELEVYPYRTAAQGEIEVENSTTYSSHGSKNVLFPDNNQGLMRSSFELAYGVTDKAEVAAYIDYARPQGEGFDHAGDRLRWRTRFFEKGELPVDVGFYAEVEFPKNADNDAELELRGIIEKDMDKWTVDFNPMLEKVIKGVESSETWEFQYAAALVYRWNERWQPRLEMFGDLGALTDFEDRDGQKHLVSPAVNIKFGRSFSLGAGIAFGLTDATEQRLLRTRLEWEF